MRLVFLIPGAGPQYCGACARDAALARGLAARGHDVLVVPLYTPLKLDADVEAAPDAPDDERGACGLHASADALAASRDDAPAGPGVIVGRAAVAAPGFDPDDDPPVDVACMLVGEDGAGGVFRRGAPCDGPDDAVGVSFAAPEPPPPSAWPTIVPKDAARPREAPLFFGGVNTYLQHLAPWAGRLPAAVRRWLDRPGVLARLAGGASRVRPAGLGRLAHAMLAGGDGPLRHETLRLADFLAAPRPAPDAILFGNALLSGAAPVLRERLPGTRLVCFAQGEELFVEQLREPYRSRVRRLVRAHARLFDLVLTTGLAGNQRAMGFMALPATRLRTVRPALDGWRYGPLGQRVREPFTVGYLSAIAPEKGLDRLAEAFQLLVHKKNRDARLWIAGRVMDRKYWKAVRKRFHRAGLEDWVTVFGELGFAGKRDFLRHISVFCAPARQPETRGMAYLEAMAAGIPVAAPNAGVLPELMRHTGGGVLLPPDSPSQWAEAFALMMDDPETADNLGKWGRARVLRHYSVDVAAEECEWRLAEMLAGDA